MSHPYDEAITTPQDAHESERLAHLHPAGWMNPKPVARYQMVILGAGPAGLAAANMAAALGAKVALIERNLLGGTNLNIGSVPSKSLIRTSRLYAEMRDAKRYGAQVPEEIQVDFAAVMQRVRGIRARLSRDDSARKLAAAGVDVFFGEARFTAADALMIDDATVCFSTALIATGARPGIPEIQGLAEAGYLTNESVFDLTQMPRRLLVIGGGPLGCEQAQAFCRLGAQVTIVQNKPLFLDKEERDAAQILSDALARDGIRVRLNTRVVEVREEMGRKAVDLVSDDYKNTIAVDAILLGTGRSPSVGGLNLEAGGVDYDGDVGIHVDDFLRSSNTRIYAAGDVCSTHQYVNTAVATARIAVRNALLGGSERRSSLAVPRCTYTDPEIAHVGLYVRDANLEGIPVKTFTIPMHEIDRAVADSEQDGFMKIHLKGRTDQILGATIVARHAGDMINEITLAMVAGIGLRTLAGVIHPYPTQAAGVRQAAEAYNRTRLTARILSRLGRRLTR